MGMCFDEWISLATPLHCTSTVPVSHLCPLHPMPPVNPSLCHCLPSTAIDFRYSDPECGFDRSRVKGVVAKLTRVVDPSTSTALEVAAGGKLYQVR